MVGVELMNPENTAPRSSPSELDAQTETRRRKLGRTRNWIVFGLFGLMMGVIWAVGIATSTATVDDAGADPAVRIFGTESPAPGVSEYAGLVTENTPLTIDFTGTWGRIDADTPMFDVDLTAESGTYFVVVYINNNATGWSVLQLEFEQINKACAATVPADWDTPDASSVMVVESEDAWAVFPDLASGVGADYCIGIEGITPYANDTAGTYIRRPSDTSSPTAPEFVALLNRSA